VSTLVYAIASGLAASRAAAWVAAVLFCVLPIHSEAVIWAVGRAELMAGAGFCAALCSLLAYRADGRAWQLAAATGLFAAALFAKENVVTLLAAPAAAALLLPPQADARRRDARATAALLSAFIVYLMVRAAAGPVLGSMAGDRLDNPLSVLSPGQRVLGALAVLGRYLALSVWPHQLSIDYSYDALGIGPGFRGDSYTLVGLGACVALSACVWHAHRREPLVAYGLALFAMTYSIVANLVVLFGTAMAERLFYLPSLGLCLAAARALEGLGLVRDRRGRAFLVTAAIASSAVVFVRAGEWGSRVSVFEAAVRAQPRSARAQMELGSAYGDVGRFDDAVQAYRRATAILPGYAAAWYNFGNLYAHRGAFEPAEQAYRTALEHAPLLGPARYNLALVLISTGRDEDAVELLKPLANSQSRDAGLAMLLGDSCLKLKRYAEAAQAYAHVLELRGDDTTARLRRAFALQQEGGCADALDEYLSVLRSVPADPTALAQATACLRADGRQAEADRLVERARVANRGPGR
jgi:tetratricopeptide (TPR) repeat protein